MLRDKLKGRRRRRDILILPKIPDSWACSKLTVFNARGQCGQFSRFFARAICYWCVIVTLFHITKLFLAFIFAISFLVFPVIRLHLVHSLFIFVMNCISFIAFSGVSIMHYTLPTWSRLRKQYIATAQESHVYKRGKKATGCTKITI